MRGYDIGEFWDPENAHYKLGESALQKGVSRPAKVGHDLHWSRKHLILNGL